MTESPETRHPSDSSRVRTAGLANSHIDLWEELLPRQKAVQIALQAHLHRLAKGTPATLLEAMEYSLLAPGKRLRPLLTILASEATGGTLEQALAAGTAVEMVHTYSLIHDDLPAMDDDDLRRGLPTSHKKFGEAMAILAGDALLTMAFEVLASSYPSKTAAVTCSELARGAGAVGMVAGQVLDLAAEGDTQLKLQDLEAIHRHKTGALFRSALRMGLFVAQAERAEGVNPAHLQGLDDYARSFGLAFQVTDDLLDVESSTEKTGKRVGKDASRGKLTYPGFLGIEASRRRAQDLGEEAVAAANRLGNGGGLLARLARYVVERDR